MKCPICADVRMREVDKNGVHIDVCPDCKGVWLDRGELDKLMPGVREVRQEYNDYHRDDDDDDDDRDKRRYEERSGSGSNSSQGSYNNNNNNNNNNNTPYGYKKKKKNSVLDVLSDLF